MVVISWQTVGALGQGLTIVYSLTEFNSHEAERYRTTAASHGRAQCTRLFIIIENNIISLNY